MKSLRSLSALVLFFLIIIAAGCSRDPNVKKQKYLDSGKKYLQAEKHQEAVIQFSNAIQTDPNFAEGHYQLAQAYIKMGYWKSAFTELSRVIDLQPDNVQAQVEVGNLLLAARQIDDAKKHSEIALQKDPQNPEAIGLAANIQAAEHNLPAA